MAVRSPEDGNFARSRELFEQFDGNRYYMALDGQLQLYERFGVPKPVEYAWLAELTDSYLAKLQERGNCRAVHFFVLHGDCRHLSVVSRQAPRGVLWERIGYLEMVLDYISACRKKGCSAGLIGARKSTMCSPKPTRCGEHAEAPPRGLASTQ